MVTKKRVEQMIFSKEILEKLRTDSGGLSLQSRSYIALFSLLFIITALSRPVSDDGVAEIESKSVDIVLAIDISKSMLATDHYPNRLVFAKQKALNVIKNMPKSRVGVIAFANNSYIVSPLTFDHQAVSYLLQNLDTESISEQGTDYGNLLGSAEEFLKSEKEKNLLIFTDGGDGESYSDEIERAKSAGFKIYVVGIGSEDGSPIPQKDGSFLKYNGDIVITSFNDNVREFATESGGLFMKSTNGDSDVKFLTDEFQKLQSVEQKKQEIPIYIEYFYYPLWVAIALLIPLFYSIPRLLRAKNLLLPLLLFASTDSEAGLFDFYYLNSASEYNQNGEYQRAIEELQKVDPSDEVNYNIGNNYYSDGNYSEAIKSYRKVSHENSELKAKALHNVGNSYFQQDMLQEAIDSYEKSLKLSDNNRTNENLQYAKEKLEEKKKQEEDQNQSGEDEEQESEEQNGNENGNSEDKDGEKGESEEQQEDGEPKEDSGDSESSDGGDLDSDNQKADSGEEKSSDSKQKETQQESGEGEAKSSDGEDNRTEEQSFIKEKLENDSNSSEPLKTTFEEGFGDENTTDRLQDEKILKALQNQDIGTKMFGILPHKESLDGVKPW
jgi:Ca-activated chloride channel family protein